MPITINNVRFSYCNLFQPVARLGQEAKFSPTILVPKSNTEAKAAMDAAIQEAINYGVAKRWNGQMPPKLDICVHDGDGPRPSDGQSFGPECRGCWVFTASSKADRKPFVVDCNVQPIIDPTQVYSGMWGNVSVNFFAYNTGVKKGIGCGLNGVQKVRDDEPLGNTVTAESAFTAVQASPSYPAAPAYQAPAPAYQAPAAAPAYQAPSAYPGGVDPFTGLPV